MAHRVEWSFNLSIEDGPDISAKRSVTVDAFELADVVVPIGAADKEIVVSSPAQFFVLTADDYGSITYKRNSNSSTDVFKLDQPLVAFGEGAMAQLDGTAAITSLFLSNSGSSDVRVRILAARDVTPLPSP